MSLWANFKFFPEPTGELYGWLLATLVFFFFFRGVGSLSQPRLNIFTVGNMRVMICLGQGGLRSLSASSFILDLLIVLDKTCVPRNILTELLFNFMTQDKTFDTFHSFQLQLQPSSV